MDYTNFKLLRMLRALDQRLADKSPEQIRKDFDNVMKNVKDREVPHWDKI